MKQEQGMAQADNVNSPRMLWSLKQWKQLMNSSQE